MPINCLFEKDINDKGIVNINAIEIVFISKKEKLIDGFFILSPLCIGELAGGGW